MKTKDLSLVAIFTAFIIVLAFVPPINIGLVPIVLQNLGIMLASLLLGMKRGMLAMIIFFLLVTAGMPFLSGGRVGRHRLVRCHCWLSLGLVAHANHCWSTDETLWWQPTLLA